MADPTAAATTAPKPKEEKITPPDPPLRIKDKERGWVYTRVGFLGEVSPLSRRKDRADDMNREALLESGRWWIKRAIIGLSRLSARATLGRKRIKQR
jgi:hypothetical protein